MDSSRLTPSKVIRIELRQVDGDLKPYNVMNMMNRKLSESYANGFSLLQSGNVENPWFSAMSSHFAYWSSPDVALFILRALHHQDVRLGPPKVTPQPAPAPAASGKAEAEGALSPKTPSSPLSPAYDSAPDTGFSQESAASKGSKEGVPKGLSDPEDWW